MLKNNSKIALIPAYNPDQKITGVVRGLKNSGFTVIIVNDGSDPEFDYLFDKSNGADEVIATRTARRPTPWSPSTRTVSTLPRTR